MTNFFVSRARRLFQYGDLEGNSSSRVRSNGESVSIESSDVSSSANSSMRVKRTRCLLLTTILFGLIIILILLITIKSSNNFVEDYEEIFENKSEFRLMNIGDLLSNKFVPNTFNGTWISDIELLYYSYEEGYVVLNAKTLKKSIILSNEMTQLFRPIHVYLSSDKRFLALQMTYTSVYRASNYGQYKILKLKDESHILYDVKPFKNPSSVFNILQFTWSPTGNGFSYVDMNNNIYIRSSVFSPDISITKNGRQDEIYNGIPDWVFEEEIFEGNEGLWWSPLGTHLLWAFFDDSNVDPVFLKIYGSFHGSESYHQYPLMQEIRYPKVNTTNPSVALFVFHLETRNIWEILKPKSFNNTECHFKRIYWHNDSVAIIHWSNRVQNHSIFSKCKMEKESSHCVELFSQSIEEGWIDDIPIAFNPNNDNEFVVLLRDDFNHLYLYSPYRDSKFLTFGNYDVVSLLKWSSEGFIYYIATLPNNPGARHLYRLKNETIECLTCSLLYYNRSLCNYVSISPSKEGSFIVLTCLGPDVPWLTLQTINSSNPLLILCDNVLLEKEIHKYNLPTSEIIHVPLEDGSSTNIRVKIYYPPNFSPDVKYPLIIEVYGGPGFQRVDESWNNYEFSSLMASEGNIYVTLDPRGSGYQGRHWLFSIYRHFGSFEVLDTLRVATYLQREFSIIDEERIAIWGWSYGGYLALSALSFESKGIFSCGVAVAPVVDWTLYDTYYTEKYMGLLYDNIHGYNESSLYWKLDNLKNKTLFLIHGSKDDNVHFQHSMILSAALQERDILFRQQVYPDQSHGIDAYHKHLYHSLSDFFINDCFHGGIE